MEKYRHTQPGWMLIIPFTVMIILISTLLESASFEREIVLGKNLVIGVLLICLALFYKMTVIIDNKLLKISFGYGLIKIKFVLSDIISASVVKNKWIHGWGIHYIGTGWLYNVSGLNAVEIKMKNGKIHRIGTNEPDELQKALKI